jgi:hypothetical protein
LVTGSDIIIPISPYTQNNALRGFSQQIEPISRSFTSSYGN